MTVEQPAFVQALTFNAEQTRRAIYCMLQRGSTVGSVIGGLVGAGDLELSYAGSGLKVSVATGEIIVPGSTSATQSGYYDRCSSAETLSPAAANSTNPRIERVVVQIKDAAYAGANNEAVIALVEGTATSGATLSNLSGVAAAPASSYTLGYVLIPAKATTITNEDIKNVAELVQLLRGVGAWQTLTPSHASFNVTTAWQARLETGNAVGRFRGAVHVISGKSYTAEETVITLPSALHPAKEVEDVAVCIPATRELLIASITTGGALSFASSLTGPVFITFEGVSVPLL